MKIKSIFLAIMIPTVILGGMAVLNALDLTKSETTREPAKFSEGEAAGEYNPEDIRGSYSFEDVSQLFEIPAEELRTAFGLPEGVNLSIFRTGDLESVYEEQLEENQEMGNSSVHLFVALYKELPYSMTEEIYLPEPAVEILKSRNVLNDEMLAYVDQYTLALEPLENAEAVAEAQAIAEEEHTEDNGLVEINGKTTFRQVMDAGVSEERVMEILGMDMPNPVMPIKDYCLENGLEFSTVKTALQDEMAAK